jgi:hypothetical protein
MRLQHALYFAKDLASVDIEHQDGLIVLCSGEQAVVRLIDSEVVEGAFDGAWELDGLNPAQGLLVTRHRLR